MAGTVCTVSVVSLRVWVYYWQLGLPLVWATSSELAHWGGVPMHENFYIAVAAVIPVLLLALMVELASAVSLELQNAGVAEAAGELDKIAGDLRTMEDLLTTGPTPLEALARLRDLQRKLAESTRKHEASVELLVSMSERIRRLVRCFFIQAAAGEGAALYALGAQRSSAFLVTLCISVLVLVTWNLWRTFEMRFEKPALPEAPAAAEPAVS
jgi:hypothetical protein